MITNVLFPFELSLYGSRKDALILFDKFVLHVSTHCSLSLILYFYNYYKELFALIFSFISKDVLAGKEDWYIRHATKYCADSIL